jgi:pimeloyl-ACP methyl ester carboxylesterase
MLLEFIASTGFIVAAPDYLGFGASKNMFHPYLEKESTVNSLIDMLRASEEFVLNHLNVESNNDLYIVGYSQGGWSTMQLQKAIELNYSSEFKLKASSCGAGPYDIRYINDNILSQNTYPMPYYVGYIINSYINSGHITNPASDIFKSPYDNRIMTMFDGTSTGAELNKQLTTVVADLVTEEYRSTYQTNPKFASVIAAQENNSVSAWKTNIPTLLTHGTDDTYVPFGVSEKLYNDFMALGVNESTVTFIPLEGADHSGGIVPSGVASFNWFIELKNAN